MTSPHEELTKGIFNITIVISISQRILEPRSCLVLTSYSETQYRIKGYTKSSTEFFCFKMAANVDGNKIFVCSCTMFDMYVYLYKHVYTFTLTH